MLSRMCDDILQAYECQPISDINYNPNSLTNLTFDMLRDSSTRRKILSANTIQGLYADLPAIQAHYKTVACDEAINQVLSELCGHFEVTDIHRIFTNCYYNKLLRAKVERECLSRELVAGLVLTGYHNTETDACLAHSMIVLRIICKYLGLTSTTHAGSFALEKLEHRKFWSSISNKFLHIFGEEYITPIAADTEDIALEAFKFLYIVFDRWSGSTLKIQDTTVHVEASMCVTHILPHMRTLIQC